MDDVLNELRGLAFRHGPQDFGTAIPRLSIRSDSAPTPPLPAVYEPMACFVLQGAKRVTVGGRTREYRGASCMVASVDLPVTGEVVLASAEAPYLALALRLDVGALAALMLDLPAQDGAAEPGGLTIGPMGEDVAEPLLRLARLLDRPAEVPVLAPMAEREILYRLLQGPQGPLLRQIALPDSRLSQIRRAVGWIRTNFAETLRIEELARLAGMSASSLHRHFKAVTGLSPLQYHKQIRLQEARRRLVAEPGEVARVAFAVGYESASQFSREYARQFGLPPARDAAALRRMPDIERAGA